MVMQEPSTVLNPLKFRNRNAKKYYLELQGKNFIQERGFKPSMVICNEIWSLVRAKKEEATLEDKGEGDEHDFPENVDDYETTF
ncbi:hypothetical protein J1N35_041464 [Gossypium stocksii]|uniref:Uncharacterized protein n=1 Tax=Gossypium stocksii TaxID=47602 RepID=A0A9D3UFT5_9ROSI|nr:hypothetical protein J1N35_041464 [Gossypium stocksii]